MSKKASAFPVGWDAETDYWLFMYGMRLETVQGVMQIIVTAFEQIARLPLRNHYSSDRPAEPYVLSEAMKAALLYAAVFLISGTILVFFDARPATNDAEAHWERAYLVSEGLYSAVEDPDNPGHFGGCIGGEFVSFNNTAVNSPLAYFPSWICGGSYRLACLLTLWFATLISAFGIFLSGKYSTLLLAPSLLPMFFFSYLYPTADAMTNSVSILFIGTVLRFCQGKRVSIGPFAGLVLLGAFLGQMKVTCIILFTLLLLPFHYWYRKTGTLYWRFALPAIVGLASALAWGRTSSGIAPVYQSYDEYASGIIRLLLNPLRFAKTVLLSTFTPLDYTDSILNGGRNSLLFLGSEFAQLPATVVAPVLIACVFLLVKGNQANKAWDRIDCLIIGITAALFFMGTHFAMLASWSASRLGQYNQGIQTRYFAPEIPLVGLLIPYLGTRIGYPSRFWRLIVLMVVYSYAGIVVAHIMPLQVETSTIVSELL